MWMSLASAAIVELPLAFLMLTAARRLIRLSALVDEPSSGRRATPSLWRTAAGRGIGRRS